MISLIVKVVVDAINVAWLVLAGALRHGNHGRQRDQHILRSSYLQGACQIFQIRRSYNCTLHYDYLRIANTIHKL